DVNELKKMFFDLLQNPGIPMHNGSYDAETAGKELAVSATGNFGPTNANAAVYYPVNRENIQQHEEVEESLSIVDKEKELIIKALKKHRGKRKDASLDLGISERTLYRKLKEYDIDE